MLMLIVLTVMVFILAFVKMTAKPPGFPPGPPRLPLLGSVPFIMTWHDLSLHKASRRMLKKYGRTCGFYMGRERIVLLSDFHMIKDVLKGNHALNRPKSSMNEALPGNHSDKQGLFFSHGSSWVEQRRFVLKQLRELGFGKSLMEKHINVSVQKLIAKLEQNADPVCIKNKFNLPVLNCLWVMICGQELDLGDPKLLNIVKTVTGVIKGERERFIFSRILPVSSMVKWPIFQNLTGYSGAKKLFDDLGNLFDGILQKRMADFDADGKCDLIDLLIKKIKHTTDPTSQFFDKKGLLSVKIILIDLFIAGSETTSNSLVWTFLYMLHHPDVQAKVHEEIDRVVGRDRMVTLDDRSSLHYTNAVLEESFRFTGLVPLNVPHETTATIKVGDYVIPPKTTVLANFYHIMNDPDYWKDPKVFRPERFLDNEGVFHHDERVVPFSVGKRLCLGQSLAEKELFVFFGGIMQAFNIRNPSGQVLPSYDIENCDADSILRSAPKFDVFFVPRK